MSDHPVVIEYVERFDLCATRLPTARRTTLREEIVAHLRDAIPNDASDDEARAAVADFGTPEEIVAHELEGEASAPRMKRRWLPRVIPAAVLLALAIAALLVVPGLLVEKSIVTATPYGPPRVTEGVVYFEYLAAIEKMPYPLPAGAEWPAGVPQTTESDEPFVLESGAGNILAQTTWICAWEHEYLTALERKDDRRLVEAQGMIEKWPFDAAYAESAEAWRDFVAAPLRFGDASAVVTDRRTSCGAAGILNVDAD